MPDSWRKPAETVAAISEATAVLLEATRAHSPDTRVFIAAPIYVAPDADDKALEARRAQLQAALDEITRRGEAWRAANS